MSDKTLPLAIYGRLDLVSESIIATYENLWLLTQQMLDAARNDEWDTLIDLEQKRGALVGVMEAGNDLSNMTMVEQQQSGEIIQRILVADEEIRACAEVWMGELQEILGSISTEKKLHKAYEAP